MTIKSPCTIQQKPRRKGFTLTEIAIVLGIIGLILGAIWSAARGVYANTAANTVTQSLGQYVANVRSLCNNTSCSGLNPITGIAATAPVPANSSITSTVQDYTETTGSDQPGFVITWKAIPTSTAGGNFCNGLASAVSGIGGSASTTAAEAAAPPATPTATCNGGTPVCATGNAGYISSTSGVTCGGTNGSTPTGTCGVPTESPGSLCKNNPASISAWFPYSFN